MQTQLLWHFICPQTKLSWQIPVQQLLPLNPKKLHWQISPSLVWIYAGPLFFWFSPLTQTQTLKTNLPYSNRLWREAFSCRKSALSCSFVARSSTHPHPSKTSWANTNPPVKPFNFKHRLLIYLSPLQLSSSCFSLAIIPTDLNWAGYLRANSTYPIYHPPPSWVAFPTAFIFFSCLLCHFEQHAAPLLNSKADAWRKLLQSAQIPPEIDRRKWMGMRKMKEGGGRGDCKDTGNGGIASMRPTCRQPCLGANIHFSINKWFQVSWPLSLIFAVSLHSEHTEETRNSCWYQRKYANDLEKNSTQASNKLGKDLILSLQRYMETDRTHASCSIIQ